MRNSNGNMETAAMYLFIDGDDVGSRMERHILNNDVAAFVEESKSTSRAIDQLAAKLATSSGADVISVGGDSILVSIQSDAIPCLTELLTSMQSSEEFPFSAGIGRSLRESFVALRMAKSSGKRRTVHFPGEDGS